MEKKRKKREGEEIRLRIRLNSIKVYQKLNCYIHSGDYFCCSIINYNSKLEVPASQLEVGGYLHDPLRTVHPCLSLLNGFLSMLVHRELRDLNHII